MILRCLALAFLSALCSCYSPPDKIKGKGPFEGYDFAPSNNIDVPFRQACVETEKSSDPKQRLSCGGFTCFLDSAEEQVWRRWGPTTVELVPDAKVDRLTCESFLLSATFDGKRLVTLEVGAGFEGTVCGVAIGSTMKGVWDREEVLHRSPDYEISFPGGATTVTRINLRYNPR